jgi:hypothetical protein
VGKSCGENIDNIAHASSQSVPKSQEKKASKKKSRDTKHSLIENTYTIPVRHFIQLAKVVVHSTNPKVVVPNGIYTLLCDVISLRKEVSQVLGQAVTQDDGQSDGHSYFINVLEQVKEILRPSTEKTVFRDEKRLETQDQKLGNIFEALDLEGQLDVTDTSHISQSARPDRKPLPKQTYDIERAHDEILVSSLFFFHDLSQIRDFVRELWTDYGQGRADLSTASLVTNTAIEIMQRNLEDHIAMMAGQHGSPEEDDWIFWVYAHICHGMDLHHRERPGDLINFETYHQAEFVCLPVFDIIKEFMESVQSHRLVFVKGYDRCTKLPESQREKDEADHLFLNLLLSDLHNATILRLEAATAIDEITRAFLEMKVSENKLVPLWLVFAMQMLLDIRNVLGNDTSQAFQELQATGQRVTAAIRHYFQFSRNHGTHGKKWHKDNDSQILKLVSFVSTWINQDLISKAVRKQSKQIPEEHGVELPPFFLMKQHPLLCGSLVYWLNLSLQEFSISLANAYDSILSAAHLYNAARKSNLLAISWPDMDYLISAHTSQRIFVGGLPSKPEDFFKRFHMVLGASVLNFARNRRAIRPHDSSKDAGCRRLRKTMPIHDIFRARYCIPEGRAELTRTKLDVVIAEAAIRHPELNHIAADANQWANTRKLTSLQLMSILRVAITDEEFHLHFDYISMHIRCATLLSEMRQKFITGGGVQVQPIISRLSESSSTRHLAEGASLTQYLAKDTPEVSLSQHLAENAMPEDHFAIQTTGSIFLSDPAAAVAAQNYIPDALIQSEILRFANVSLQRASELMSGVIEKEGDLDIKKAAALSKPIILSDNSPKPPLAAVGFTM